MTLRSADPSTPWTDYTTTSHLSGKTYRVALRGFDAGQSYCTCPDYRTNHLGTCKHILNAQSKVRYVTDIMEGGREAFQYRQTIYQPHWRGPISE